eukprot:scaffold341704_cov17-Prasinocladus_malaysianus.AAC.1
MTLSIKCELARVQNDNHALILACNLSGSGHPEQSGIISHAWTIMRSFKQKAQRTRITYIEISYQTVNR